MPDKMTPEERREWRYCFAGQAMAGILSNAWSAKDRNTLSFHEVASESVGYADALLAELEKDNNDG